MNATTPLLRRAVAEFLGTGLLVTVIVGSGIAAQQLSTDIGLRLLENSIATGIGLAVLILLFAPVSGAHFNPVVTLTDAFLARRTETARQGRAIAVYLIAQILGAIGGALLANAMFEIPAALSSTHRATPGTVVGEVVASAGLVLLIFGLTRARQRLPVMAAAVGAYIGSAYWFTSSTSFANPAVTIGRIFTDTFAGITPASAPIFVAAQLLGAAIGIASTTALFPTPPPPRIESPERTPS